MRLHIPNGNGTHLPIPTLKAALQNPDLNASCTSIITSPVKTMSSASRMLRIRLIRLGQVFYNVFLLGKSFVQTCALAKRGLDHDNEE